MIKTFILLLAIFTFVFCLFPLKVSAFDPSLPNNKFGIHMLDTNTNDSQKAAELVNSTGGRWGYVTLVIQDNDKNVSKWQDVFNNLRKLHLTPIIRLATHPDQDNWIRPATDDADSWVNFLNSLKWVVKDRYIVLFNEPNQGHEWGGNVDPQSYTDVVSTFAQKLKDKSKDFFIMLGGLDASAPSASPAFEDEAVFLRQMIAAKANLFDNIDGWVSHSYPNPGYVGSPLASGRNSVRNYDWELNLLKDLGVSKDLPVFITETGWSHNALSDQTVANYTQSAFTNIWLQDGRVRAVTPFVLSYQAEPFTSFSWKKLGSEDFYPVFSQIKSLPKVGGQPQQIEAGQIIYHFPQELLAESNYHFILRLTNQGQAIWDKEDSYYIKLEGSNVIKEYFFSDIKGVEPGKSVDVDFYFKTNNDLNKEAVKLALYKDSKPVLEGDNWKLAILALPSLNFQVKLFPKLQSSGDNFEIQVFDDKQELVYKKQGIDVNNGIGNISEIRNIYLGGKYRIVILNPYYLPRQGFITFHKGVNKIIFVPMLPFDLNRNGHLDVGDIIGLIRNPQQWVLFLP